MSIVLFNLFEGPLDTFSFEIVGFDSTPTTNIEYNNASLTDTVGFHDACWWIQDVVDRLQESNTVYLTDTVGFNDTLLAPEGSIIETPDWSIDNVWSEYNNFTYLINYLFDSVGFQELPSYVKQIISDSELFPWSYYDVWSDDYGWDDSGLVDLEKLITLFDSISFQDGLDHNLGFIYEEWEITIWDRTRVWEESYSFIGEGKTTGIELSDDDSFGFDDILSNIIIYNPISLSDHIGFDEDILLYDAYRLLEDHFGFDDFLSYLSFDITKTLDDHVGFQEVITPITTLLSSLIDTVGFQETTPIGSLVFIPIELLDDFGFNDRPSTGDIILKWFGRTHNKYTGYGGFPYGDIGYGEGYLTDVKEYKMYIYISGSLLKIKTISLEDKTDSEYYHVYSRAENELDNGIIKYPLFEVYEVDNYDNLSVKQSVQSVAPS